MSHPDPSHDPEDERVDDDLLLEEIDARIREDEQAVLDESLRIAAYADNRMAFDRERYWSGDGTGDLTTSGADMADKQRMIVAPQMQARLDYSNKQKERK